MFGRLTGAPVPPTHQGLDIRIEPHTGAKEIPGRGFVEIDLNQDRIFVGKYCVGYLSRKTDTPIRLIGTVAPATAERIRDAVNAHFMADIPNRKMITPPAIGGVKESE